MINRKLWSVAVILLIVGTYLGVAQAQGPGWQGPKMLGIWEPKVGSGAAYRIETKKAAESSTWEWAVVGTEKVGADTGYWVEMYGQQRRGEAVVMKQLTVWRGDHPEIKRMIVQTGTEPPMELPMTMMGARQPTSEQRDVRQRGKRVGTETIVTPAGSFSCEHWQETDSTGTHDVWVSKDVAPYGLVKASDPETTMTLVRVISSAISRIKGTPRSMEEMMREQQRHE